MIEFITNAPFNSLFFIYLLISCNFLAQLFGCQLQKILNNNMIAKHIFGFLTMLFCIIYTDSTIQKESKFLEGFFYAIIFYLWFWSTTKTNIYFTIIIIFLFMVIYSLQLKKNSDEDIENKKNYSLAQLILAIISFILTIIGIIFDIYQQNKQNKWSWNTFILGAPKCE